MAWENIERAAEEAMRAEAEKKRQATIDEERRAAAEALQRQIEMRDAFAAESQECRRRFAEQQQAIIAADEQRRRDEEKLFEESLEQPPISYEPSKDMNYRANGKFRVEAEIISYANGTVTLRRRDGSRIKVVVTKLQQADRDFISEWRRQL